MAKENSLVALLKHPEVKKRLNLGTLSGLSGSTQIDYAIGVIERTVAELGKVNAADSVRENLREKYNRLKEDPIYAKYFQKPILDSRNQEDWKKNPTYNALCGF